MSSLNNLLKQLKAANYPSYQAYIPSVWLTSEAPATAASGILEDKANFQTDGLSTRTQASPKQELTLVNFPEFIIDSIEQLCQLPDKLASNSQQFNKKVSNRINTIYNLMVRLASAFDHNQDGKIINEENKFKETGTILKTILILPYIKSLGVDVLYLLPITEIGIYGRKGDLGSPYSIKNPYQIDSNLAEPLLNISIEEQFDALVEAAHNLDIKVVCEFIFRTASKDSDIAIKHPEWFYWIKECDEDTFHAPKFNTEQITNIKNKIQNNDFNNLPEPNIEFQNMFQPPPKQVVIENNKIIGISNEGQRLTIPGAFADWPPDDIQPPWKDVTYLRLYNHSEFNYIAYNTIRMYDNKLAQHLWENTELWRYLENIIPYYQKNFHIDGVMIDMGHALPHNLLQRIIAKARKYNKDFLFWEENFTLNQNSSQIGFNLVLGYLPFDQHNPIKMQSFATNIANNKFPIQCFATPETHNTPRAATRKGGIQFSKIAYTINKLLPFPTFILSGFELGETRPMNTGLGFDGIDTNLLTEHYLPLFSSSSLDWHSDKELLDFILYINEKLNEYLHDNQCVNIRIPTYFTKKAEIVFVMECSTNNIANKIILIANYNDITENIQLVLENNEQIKCIYCETPVNQNQNLVTINLNAYSVTLLIKSQV